MNGNLYFLVMAALVVGVFVLELFRRKLVRKARKVGSDLGMRHTATKAEEMVAELSRTLVLATDADTARTLVDGVVAKKRHMQAVRSGTWTLEFATKDAVIVTMTPSATGQELKLVRAGEALGLPDGYPTWKTFVAGVQAAADQAGVPLTEGRQPLARQPGGSDVEWVLAS